jgi:hypothetical protein
VSALTFLVFFFLRWNACSLAGNCDLSRMTRTCFISLCLLPPRISYFLFSVKLYAELFDRAFSCRMTAWLTSPLSLQRHSALGLCFILPLRPEMKSLFCCLCFIGWAHWPPLLHTPLYFFWLNILFFFTGSLIYINKNTNRYAHFCPSLLRVFLDALIAAARVC